MHLIKKCAFFALSLLFVSCNLIDGDRKTGQYTIKGTVLNKADGKPVSGVEISIKGVSISQETGADGTFTLEGVGKGTVLLKAKKPGWTLIPAFKNASEVSSGSNLNVAHASENGVVNGADFIAVEGASVTISDIQGSSLESPLKDEMVYGVTGVVTMICRRAPHFKYDTTDLDGETVPQWLSCDGFFLEALPQDKDLSGKKSNGIFVNTHDPAFDSTEESHWKDGIPTDLQAGDVVVVSGKVEETRHLDRFDSAAGVLSRTEINAAEYGTVTRRYTAEVPETAPYPDGVLLTYSEAFASAWKAGHENDGMREARVLPVDSDSSTPMKEAINAFETVESMVIRIKNPLVVGATYYNLTTVLPDGGTLDAASDGTPGTKYPRTFNKNWSGDVIWERNDGIQDFNEEIIFVDYQAVDWTTFYPITQMGDYLKDKSGSRMFRGVMDYTVDGLYMAHPLNHTEGCYVQASSNADTSLTPYYTAPGKSNEKLTSVTGEQIPDQSWDFDTTDAWYTKAAGSTIAGYMTNGGAGGTKLTSNNIQNNVVPWRTGNWNTGATANALFTPSWTDKFDSAKGNTDLNSLTVAAFNIENYEAQGSANSKQENVARVIKNNLLYPDVLIIVEMGDDKSTMINYDNQNNSYAAEKDGVVTAVKNFSGIIDVIKKKGGPQYDFRCVDPKEQDSGGKPGVNIRVGLLYNTKRVTAVDNGLPNNNYLTTHGSVDSEGNVTNSYTGKLLDEKYWPVQTSNRHAEGWTLAEVSAGVYKGKDGKPHLTQSPSYIHSSYFSNSRRPVISEFVINDSDGKPTKENFFVMGCHLGSKRGDYPLYGSVQPPLLLSEVKRDGQARTVYEFVKSILSVDSNAKVVVGGDMNDFAYSTPQKILKGELGGQILWSITEELMPVQEQFSYTFHGNLQEIDHLFVTDALF